MSDRSDRERDKLWGRALADALKYALYRTRNASRAEELAADALTAALDPERSPWNSAGPRTLSQHVVNLVHEALKAERAKRRVREDPVNALEVETRMHREVPRPDAALRARQKRGRGLERERRVREGLDPFAQRVLDLFGDGLTPGEQALRLEEDVGKVYAARRRIAERIRALPAEPDDDIDLADAALQDRDDAPDRDGEEEGEVST
jgi:DNA-directed RNA polymerase specialized sigma24 family protein